MEKINHNNLPDGIEFLISRIENLESLILHNYKSTEPTINDRIDRIEEACLILKCSKSKIYKLTMNDKIPHQHTTTGRLIFSRKKLLKWQEENIFEDKPKNNVLLSIAESALKK